MRGLFALILTGVAFGISGCQTQAHENKGQTVTPVTVVSVQKQNVVRPIQASGLLTAPRQVALSFKTGGIIAKITVDEGTVFHKGDLLARLDLREIQAYAAQAGAVREKAERDAARVEKLYADSAASLEQLQNVQTALQAVRAQYDVAGFNLEKSKIRAPFDGRVLKRLLEAGEISGPGTPVMLVGNRSEQPIIKAALSDRDILRCKLGDRAEVYFDAYPNRMFPGRIKRLAGMALPGSGVFEIEIGLDKTKASLLSGFVATVTIFPGQTRPMTVIPAAALTEASGQDGFVYLYDPGRGIVKKQQVVIAYILNEKIALEKGVGTGDEIVEYGAAYLTDGQRVQPMDEASVKP